MKKAVLVLALVLAFGAVYATVKKDLEEYAGQYVFLEESPIDAVDITLSDSTLVVVTELGEITLKYIGDDRFSIPQYGGISVFERDESRKISGVTVSIPMAGINELKATKR